MKTHLFGASVLFVLAVSNLCSQSLMDGWIKYESPEGKYSILLPESPQLRERGLHYALANGKDFKTTTGWAEVPQGFSLERGRDGFVNSLQGKLVSERRVSIGGYAGYEWKVETRISGNDELYWARSYLVGTRTYLLQFFGPKGSFESQALVDAANKYFDSFSVQAVQSSEVRR